MIESTIDAEPTFAPWYAGKPLVLPPDPRTAEDRALRSFGRKCRADRIKANITAFPSRSMLSLSDESGRAA